MLDPTQQAETLRTLTHEWSRTLRRAARAVELMAGEPQVGLSPKTVAPRAAWGAHLADRRALGLRPLVAPRVRVARGPHRLTTLRLRGAAPILWSKKGTPLVTQCGIIAEQP
jgi:hypothetical protein